jgi:amylosucrase
LGQVQDLANRESPAIFNGRLVVPPFRFYWLSDQRLGAAL